MEMEVPATVSTARCAGEMLAAGPILNTAIGLSMGDVPTLTRRYFTRGGSPRVPSGSNRVLINGLSYEGRCASMIVGKTAGGTS